MPISNTFLDYLSQVISIENFIKFFVLYFFVVWISILIWVIKDITNRTESVAFQIFCIALILFLTPIFGFFLYLIIRPSRTLFEAYYDEVDGNLEFLQAQIKKKYEIVEKIICPSCKTEISEDSKYCPVCGHKLFLDKVKKIKIEK